MTTLSFEEINKIDIIIVLESLNIHPVKIFGNSYWYNSPFLGQAGNTPTFKVDRTSNRWWDYTFKKCSKPMPTPSERGFTLTDFGVRYFNCTIKELKEKLSTLYQNVPHSQQPEIPQMQQNIEIVQTFPIRSFYLIRYLWEIRIPLDVARLYCVEAQYTFGPKPYYAIGFRSDAGGYELRSKLHKYSSQPQSPTWIINHSNEIAIFEAFLDMLTFITFTCTPASGLPDLLVLNSTAFIESSIPLLTRYSSKHLFLNNNPTGKKYTLSALRLNAGYVDHSALYAGYNDLNQWVCNIGKANIPGLDTPG